MPSWYGHLKAAEKLGCRPWELPGLEETAGCVIWKHWAIAALEAEGRGQALAAKRR